MNGGKTTYREIDNGNLRRVLEKVNKNEVKLDITCKKRTWSKDLFNVTLQGITISKNLILATHK